MKSLLKSILVVTMLSFAATASFSNPNIKDTKVYVSQFGAMPNDGKDDGPGITQALAYAKKNGINAIYFSAGTYNINEAVNLTASIIGEGKVILKLGDNAKSYMFNIDCDDMSILNLNFDGNRTTQPAPGFTENYVGFNKNSLIQAFHFFRKLHVKNCDFYNCVMGAFAFASSASKGVETPYPDKDPKNDRVPQSMVIESCNFSNMGTQAINAAFNYNLTNSSNGVLRFPGNVKLLNCNFKSIGTFTPNQPVLNRFRQGDTFVCIGVDSLLVQGCSFENSQRYDIKLGELNHVMVRDCKTHNPRWGFFQAQNAKISKGSDAYMIGNITVINNHYLFDLPDDSVAKTEVSIGLFAQLKGSTAKNVGAEDYYDNVNISHNFIAYSGACSKTWDCIQMNEYAKYKKVTVEDNYVQNNRRGFVSFAKIVIDNWQMDSLVIKNNVAFNDVAKITDNSLFFAQGTSNNKIDHLIIENNIAVGYNITVKSDADICNHLIVNNNKFAAASGHIFVFGNKNNSFTDANITHNSFNGDVQDQGPSKASAVKFTSNSFSKPNYASSSNKDYSPMNSSVTNFQVSMSELKNYKIIANHINDKTLSDELSKLVSKGVISNN